MAKYIELLNEGKEEKEKKQNVLAAANAKANTEKYISDRKAKATTLAAARASRLAAVPFNVDAVVAVDSEIAQNDKELSTAQLLLTELFAE